MIEEYLYALVFMVIISGGSGVFILLSRLLTLSEKNKDGRIAAENYESGFSTLSDTDKRFAVPYFRAALFSGLVILILLLLLPLALVFHSLGASGLILLGILMVLGITGFLYALKRGLQSW